MFKTRAQMVRTASLLVVAVAVAAIGFARLHGSSLRATVIRLGGRVAALGEPKPYQADIFVPIGFDAQDHSLSCEVASLKMVLGHRGVLVDEADLISRMGTDPTPRFWQNGSLVWGDPDVAFVGDIDGRMMVSGYGAHWRPLERVARSFRAARGFENGTVADLVRELAARNPVIIWGCVGPCTERSWRTPAGRHVRAADYEHTFVVNGLSGDPAAPDGFFMVDSIYGLRYMEMTQFVRMWDVLGRSGLVVY